MTEHDERLSRLYRRRDGEAPSEFSDALIQRQARAAVGRRRALLWLRPLAVAATLLLAVGIVLKLGVEPGVAPLAIDEAPPAASAPAPAADANRQQYLLEQEIRQRMAEEIRARSQRLEVRKAAKPMADFSHMEALDGELESLLQADPSRLLAALRDRPVAFQERVIDALRARGRGAQADALERDLAASADGNRSPSNVSPSAPD